MAINPKDAPNAAAEDDEDDLFGSEEEEEDPEAVRQREENLAAYKKKKEGKTKPAAKSIVTMDVKPWGKLIVEASTTPRFALRFALHASAAFEFRLLKGLR